MISHFEKCPDNWSMLRIDEIAILQNGTGFPPNAQGLTNGTIPFLKVSDMNLPKNARFIEEWNNSITEEQVSELKAKIFPAGAVIFPKIGGAIATNKKRVLTIPSCFDNNVMGLKARQGVLDEFLYWMLQAIDLVSWSSSSSLPSMKASTVKEFLVPVPTMEEQKRIVEKLDATLIRIDTAIEHLQESLVLADSLAQNCLDVYFAELSNSYPDIALSEIVNFISGYAFKSEDFSSDSGIKPIKITHVGVNEFSENTEEFLPANYRQEFDRFSVKENDIVIALTRPIINGGLKVCRVPESYSGALVNQRVAAITSENKTLLDFVYLYLKSTRTKNYVLEKSKSLNQPNLSITDLKNLILPLPTDYEVIATAVSYCNSLLAKAKNTKTEVLDKIVLLNQLKASILDSAFKGEL